MAGVRTILVISGAEAGPVQPDVTVVTLPMSQISARTISIVLPDLVIMPLFGPGFDAIEALSQLEKFGFRGEVVVRTPALPNSRIVERELSAVVPALTVRLTGPVS
jgi:hypothetical protein